MNSRNSLLACLALCTAPIESFLFSGPTLNSRAFCRIQLEGKKDKDVVDNKPQSQNNMLIGSICEFDDGKGRTHIGSVGAMEYKSNGGARFAMKGADGKTYSIAEKMVTFSTPPPANPKECEKLIKDLNTAHAEDAVQLRNALNVDAELISLAWEESEQSQDSSDTITADSFIKLVSGVPVSSPTMKYRAWRLLGFTDLGHIFFKAIKEKGRVTSFRAKTAIAVEDAKKAFCGSNAKNVLDEPELCLV